MTQTTLSVDDTSDVIDALRARFPKIVGPRKDDICYATTNRQEAVRALAEQADVVLVVGSKTPPTLTVWPSWRSGWESGLSD
jgi:4-hydroxy-3-methylbut-2-enyl diphosphate reductase